MGMFKRISDIVAANFNDLVEQYEDPEKMLKQAIREMEEAIDKARPSVAKAMANQKVLAKELASNESQMELWRGRAETAVEAGDDDLARKAIGRKREYEKIAAALRDQHAAGEEASQTLRRQLEAMQAKLNDARRRLGTLAARKKAAEIRTKIAKADVQVDLDQNAFSKFERMSRKVELAEAEAEAISELSGDGGAGADQDESVEDLELESELELLKRQKKEQAGS